MCPDKLKLPYCILGAHEPFIDIHRPLRRTKNTHMTCLNINLADLIKGNISS